MKGQPMTAQDTTQKQIERAYRVQQKYCDKLMAFPHVVGTGIGFARQHGERTDEVALIVMVDRKLDDDELSRDERLPHNLDGVRVDVQEFGTFTAS
jgi:hypothetical protein